MCIDVTCSCIRGGPWGVRHCSPMTVPMREVVPSTSCTAFRERPCRPVHQRAPCEDKVRPGELSAAVHLIPPDRRIPLKPLMLLMP